MPTPLAETAETRVVAVTWPDAWQVGAESSGAMFGGYLAARVVEIAREAMDAPTAVPLSLSISYHRPVAPGDGTVAVTVAHRGSRISTLTVVIAPGSRPAATAQVVLGTGLVPDALAMRRPRLLPSQAAPAAGDLSAVVDWRAFPDPWGAPAGEPLTAWIRPCQGWRTGEGSLDPAWFAVAADLIGPALAWREAFRVVTVSLDMRVHATTQSDWVQQRVTAHRTGDLAVANVELSDPAGVVVATATQTAVLVAASPEQLPSSVTAFGWGIPDSSIHAQMIGLN